MKEFFSNAWVISIISGILVFFITSLFIMLYNKVQHKRQIEEANQSVINHLRGYVVDNGLPEKEIIDAVRVSVAREYNIRDETLLTTKAFCEELIKEIIGNIYISNQNKIVYLDMLKAYLSANKELDSNQCSDGLEKYSNKEDLASSFIAATVTGIFGILASFFSFLTDEKISFQNWDTDGVVIAICAIVVLSTFVLVYVGYKRKKRKKK